MKVLKLLFFLEFLSFSYQSHGQQNLWKKINEESIAKSSNSRLTTPEKYDVLSFDYGGFNSFLEQQSRSNSEEFIMKFPFPDGSTQSFYMIETPVFDDLLSLKYPGYTSFTGKGIDSPAAFLKLSKSPYGIHVMIMHEGYSTIYIDPYTQHNQTEYIIYYKKDLKNKAEKFTCGISEKHRALRADEKRVSPESSGARVGDCTLRTYRLALACTGEYAKFHGGTVEKVLAAYNATMTRVNGLYERDAAITMELISNTDKLIYLVGATDPYTNTDGGTMLDENQENIDNVIGFSKYDIGHVFSTGGGGIAQLRAPCSSSKAQGVTGSSAPIGDAFDIDYVAHEMGHQFGADHTQNNDCQRNGPTAMEPGSGSTIMGYAGICDPNIQDNSDDHFHAVSLGEIANFVVAGSGNTCAVKTDIDNQKPTVNVSQNSYTIPVSTSFLLKANGTDADGDILSYCWEQIDNETATMPPKSTSTVGPSFRSLSPSTSPIRYFPDLQRRYIQWEVLPTVVRNMDFRCTVRDNNIKGGCTDEVNVEVKTSTAAGPFLVTYPNSALVNWLVGTKQTVTWDVAKTDLSPINCKFVNLMLSTDGGKTYPLTLATALPNTGSYEIETPNMPTSTAKVMVVANDNIFFDVSNANFKITTSFSVSSDISKVDICNQTEVKATITLNKVQDINQSVDLSVINAPNELLFSFSNNPVVVPASSILTISNLQSLSQGKKSFKIQASNSSNEKLTTDIELFVGNKIPIKANPLSPANYSSDVPSENVNFTWEDIAGIKDYNIEISTSPSFTPLIRSSIVALNSYKTNLISGKVYYWQVKANSPCIINSFGPTYSFKTSTTPISQSAILLTNEILVVNAGQTGEINQNKINISSTNSENCQVIVTSLPNNGALKVDGSIISIGGIIKLSEIINNKLVYTHDGGSTENDAFKFDILDEQNRWLPGNSFNIIIRQTNLGIAAFKEKELFCFGDANAIITAEGFGGISPYTYSLDNISFQTSNKFENLSNGAYTVFVKDAIGAIKSSNVINISSPLQIQMLVATDKYDIKILANGGKGMLNFSIDDINYFPSTVIKDPGNGLYTIFVKDENGCKISSQVAINIPKLESTAGITTDVLCSGQKAKFEVIGSGGIAPYTYSSNGVDYQNSGTFMLSAGKYKFTTKDAGDKLIESDTFQTANPSPINIVFMPNKFDITVNVTGGTPPYEYSLDNVDFISSNVITVSGNGTYKIYVKDVNQCTKSNNISINILSNVNQTVKQISCNGKNDGSVKLLAANGTAPFRYSFNGLPFGTIKEWPNLSPNTYTYVVKDAKNDSISGSIQIIEPDALKTELQINQKNLTIVVTGGTPPYKYSIDGGAIYVDSNIFNDLAENIYNVSIKDKNGCIVTTTAVITSSTDFQLNVDISLTPNPVSDFVSIKSRSFGLPGTTIKLANITGQTLDISNKLVKNSEVWVLNTKELTAGIYIVSIVTSSKTISKLFIKQ